MANTAIEKHVVTTWECELGWGKKPGKVHHFDTEEEAKTFEEDYNKDIGSKFTHNYYWRADYEGKKWIRQ